MIKTLIMVVIFGLGLAFLYELNLIDGGSASAIWAILSILTGVLVIGSNVNIHTLQIDCMYSNIERVDTSDNPGMVKFKIGTRYKLTLWTNDESLVITDRVMGYVFNYNEPIRSLEQFEHVMSIYDIRVDRKKGLL